VSSALIILLLIFLFVLLIIFIIPLVLNFLVRLLILLILLVLVFTIKEAGVKMAENMVILFNRGPVMSWNTTKTTRNINAAGRTFIFIRFTTKLFMGVNNLKTTWLKCQNCPTASRNTSAADIQDSAVTSLQGLLRVQVRIQGCAHSAKVPGRNDIAVPDVPAFCDALNIGAKQIVALSIVMGIDERNAGNIANMGFDPCPPVQRAVW
jgi:hypothetical protein